MNSNDRLHALKILTGTLNKKISLTQSMSAFKEVSPLTKELCFGCCRHYFRLERIALSLMDKKPKETEVWLMLLMGLYQLHYLNIPDYAVVKETVALCDMIQKKWAKGLINAVLRRFCRSKDAILNAVSEDPDFLYGQPPFLSERYQKNWPDDWISIIRAQDTRAPMVLRVNRQKKSVQDYLQALNKAQIEAKIHPVAPAGIILMAPCDVYELPGFTEGWVSVQDGAAQLAAFLLSLKPGQRVLDACCAPGGKTCHILELEPGIEECVALELDPERLAKVKDNLTRLNLKAHLVQGDALMPDSWWDKKLFDRILLDAPCSATGVIRRHSDIKLLRTLEEIQNVSEIQRAMLRALWPLLAVGGLMVYATCSILGEENELQIAEFSKSMGDCQVLPINQSWGRPTGHGQQILPGEQEMDGFFYSVLQKSAAV